MSEMKEPVEVVHLIDGAALPTEELELTRGGWTIERLVGERFSGRAMVPPPLYVYKIVLGAWSSGEGGDRRTSRRVFCGDSDWGGDICMLMGGGGLTLSITNVYYCQ